MARPVEQPEAYVCLSCGSRDGEPSDNNCQLWYWRTLPFGKVGPFCSNGHADRFQMPDPRSGEMFSLPEWERLRFCRWRHAGTGIDDGQLLLPGPADAADVSATAP